MGLGSDTDSVDLVPDSRNAFALDTTVFGLMEWCLDQSECGHVLRNRTRVVQHESVL